jgi:hypothetical protein
MEGEPQPHGEAAYPSLGLIHELALRQLEGRVERIDALDSKLGALLGFTAIVLALLLNSDVVLGRWNWITTVGASLLLLGLLLLFFAFAARISRLDPDLRALREQHTSRSPVETRLQIIDAAIDAVHENDVVIVWKSRYLDAAVLLALFGLLVVTGRVIYFLQGGS